MILKKTDRRFNLHYLGFKYYIEFGDNYKNWLNMRRYYRTFKKLHGKEYCKYYRKDGTWKLSETDKHCRIYFKEHKMLTLVHLALPKETPL